MAINAGPDVIEDGLVLCLDAANKRSYPGTGTAWTNLRRRKNNAVLTNGPSFSTENRGAFSLDGTNDMILIADSADEIPVTDFPLSIAVWVKTTSVKAYIFSLTAAPSSTLQEYDLYIQENKTKSRIDGTTANFNTTLENASTINDGKWHYVVGTSSSSSNHKTYIDGQLISTLTTDVGSMGANPFNSFVIGARIVNPNRTTHYIQGNFGVCKAYNRALTADEIRQNYEATIGRYV